MRTHTLVLCTALLLTGVSTDAQFRRGMFGEAREIMLFPVDPPGLLLPAGTVEVTVRNSSSASARIAEQMRDRLARQLTGNDSRLRLADQNADMSIVATLTEFTQNRRDSTKYVSERRQVGVKEVTDKNGKKRTEPVYEYGSNKPSVVISGAAAVRLEVRPRSGGTPLADESARHTIQEEHLTSEGPPSRDAVEDLLLDAVVNKVSGRITPGRQGVRVLLARSDEVDPFNSVAMDRRWNDWLTELDRVRPHRDRKRDAYRLHNFAVAHEALAYEAATPRETLARLGQAVPLITQAALQHADEKYILESRNRISSSIAAYQRLEQLYQQAPGGAAPRPPAPTAAPAAAPQGPAHPSGTAPMSNKDVIDLRVAGLDDDNLIASINEAKSVSFDLSPAGLKSLLEAKVTNRVINAMRARAKTQ